MILQLNPPIPMTDLATNKQVLAHFIIDYGPEWHVMWGCFNQEGEVWWLTNPLVRARDNPSVGRNIKQTASEKPKQKKSKKQS